MKAPLAVPSFALPAGAAKLVSLLPPPSPPLNPLLNTDPPKTLPFVAPEELKADSSAPPNPEDVDLANDPNPAFACGSDLPSESGFFGLVAADESKGLEVAAVVEPPRAPKGDVDEDERAAKPEDANAAKVARLGSFSARFAPAAEALAEEKASGGAFVGESVDVVPNVLSG